MPQITISQSTLLSLKIPFKSVKKYDINRDIFFVDSRRVRRAIRKIRRYKTGSMDVNLWHRARIRNWSRKYGGWVPWKTFNG
jgi:hypothetical protein